MISGLLIGIGMILPGVSGGVLAVILGVYEKIINSIVHFKENRRENAKFLIPVILGVCVGAIIFANILKYVFDKYYIESCYLFIGLILGSVPYLIKEVKQHDKKGINYIILVITFLLSVCATLFFKENVNLSVTLTNSFESMLKLFLTGVIFISGKIIPGISSSFMLMMIGMYNYFLKIMSNPYFVLKEEMLHMVPLIIGMVVGALFFVKLMDILLRKYYSITYSVIIGFVVGSVVAIYPNDVTIIGIILLLTGILVSYKFSLIKK